MTDGDSPVTLDGVEHKLVNFADGTYRWIDVKRFHWNGGGGDREVLAALIENPWYRDCYAVENSHQKDSETIHGPYWIASMSADDFDPIAQSVAREEIDEFSDLYESPPSPEVRRAIETRTRVHDGTCYRLHRLPHALHDWGNVIDEFRELVFLSRAENEIALIVMGID